MDANDWKNPPGPDTLIFGHGESTITPIERRVTAWKPIQHTSLNALETKVNDMIAEGWHVFGNMDSFEMVTDKPIPVRQFVQAMVKYGT